ncbi:MAG: DUF1800 domain-containing protein [Bacteroidetes bacterium]|jgi:uncharacterized protein (DUF1800 family)|nr:DUF1800 domain-containing protein [Bacteroidota bacterium]
MIASAQRTARTMAGIDTYKGSWTNNEVLHLLRRTMFGATKSDINYFASMSMSDAVDELLNPSSFKPSPPVNNYNNGRITDPDIALGDTWVNGPTNATLQNARVNSLRSWWYGQMLGQDRSILEKMTLFWHNHFSTETQVYRDPIYGYNHQQLLRENSLGDFKNLVKLITIDPAMLVYLNGERNTRRAPDENYARELQELFTLGKGEDSKYTELDVQQAARVLTGWRVNRTNYTSYFLPNLHDADDKTFSSFFGSKTITGQSGANGANELDDLLDMIFLQTEVSKFMCRKLYRWFVYYEIDAAAETNVIEPLAAIFRNNNYQVKPVLEALFKSEHFFDVVNQGCLIKSPIDYSVGMMRHNGVEFPTSANVVEQYYMWQIVGQVCALQQQNVGDPPNVAGWPAYYQIPQYHEIWINTDTLPKRNQISDIMILTGVSRNGQTMVIDPIVVAEMFDAPEDAATLVEDMVDYYYTLDVSSDQKEYMRSFLLSGQAASYWTDAWNAYQADPTNASLKNVVKLRLQGLVKYLMNLSEYQLS